MQEQASNPLELPWSNARVVSVKDKAPRKVSGEIQGGERKGTTDEGVEMNKTTSKLGAYGTLAANGWAIGAG